MSLAGLWTIAFATLAFDAVRDGDWQFLAFIVGLSVVLHGGRAAFARSPYANPNHPIWPSKNPTDYR